MRVRSLVLLTLGLGSALVCPGGAAAFNGLAHQLLTGQAVNSSALHLILEKNLSDFDAGVLTSLGNRTVRRVIQEGSVSEDTPDRRVLNHFHDPTKSWHDAGFQFAFIQGQSSILWAQNSDQGGPTERFSWYDARNAYYQALTGSTRTIRDTGFVQTFGL